MDGQGRDPAVRAGIAAGLAGLAAFLVLHHVWITPIWFVAPVGAVMAAGGGAIVGAAFAEVLPRLPQRPWRTLAVVAGATAILAPAIVVAEGVGPIYAMAGEDGRLLVGSGEAVAVFLVGLIGTAGISGAVLGALVSHTGRAAGWTALAGVALAMGPGHNIPLLGATPATAKELTILAVVAVVSALVLVEGHAAGVRRRAEWASGAPGEYPVPTDSSG